MAEQAPGNRLAAILGPTASGKSRLALQIAPSLAAEIVSVDSMQVYRGMDIGTAKPTPAERKAVRHHLIDLVEAGEDFSVALFQARARAALEDIAARGGRALLVGGTGLYFEAIVYDLSFPPGGAEDDLSRSLRAEQQRDPQGLRARLARVDPEFASSPDFANPRRVLRALEVFERTGRPFSSLRRERGRRDLLYPYAGVALNPPREALYRAIDRRVDAMFAAGLVEEVKTLADSGGLSRTAAQALGYKEVLDHLDRAIPLEDTIIDIKRRSRHYAKRQSTWFKRVPGLFRVELGEEDLLRPGARVVQEVRERLEQGMEGGV